ncbi:hypothetical protein FRB99_001952 [Tulasnella sp. 403]|nr:hypothetical protein FRB99_001952 [Tulasnella sp. 403]
MTVHASHLFKPGRATGSNNVAASLKGFSLDPKDQTCAPATGLYILERQEASPCFYIPATWLAIRVSKMVHPRMQQVVINALIAARDAGLKPPNCGDHRSESAVNAYHFGISSEYRSRPFVTSDTLLQSPEVREALKNLFSIIRRKIVCPVYDILKEYDPKVAKAFNRRVHKAEHSQGNFFVRHVANVDSDQPVF